LRWAVFLFLVASPLALLVPTGAAAASETVPLHAVRQAGEAHLDRLRESDAGRIGTVRAGGRAICNMSLHTPSNISMLTVMLIDIQASTTH
jgi:hypothetical protein